MSKNRIRFKITSGDMETGHSCDCYKWIHHLATNSLKLEDLQALYLGKFPSGKMFVLDMLEFMRRSDVHLDRFLSSRGGVKPDDHLSIEIDEVRQLLNREFPQLVERLNGPEFSKKIIKRRPGAVDLTPLGEFGKKG